MKIQVKKEGWTYASDLPSHILREMDLDESSLKDTLDWLFDTKEEAEMELGTEKLKKFEVKVEVSVKEMGLIGIKGRPFTNKSDWSDFRKTDIKRLEIWLRKTPEERINVCPWKDLRRRRCELCRKIFPKVNRYFLEGYDGCPCDLLNEKHIIKVIRKGIEKWKKENQRK